MVGGEHRWVDADDRGNGWMAPKLFFDKLTDMLPVPARGMFKAAVKKQIPRVQGRRIQDSRLGSKGRQVEYGIDSLQSKRCHRALDQCADPSNRGEGTGVVV